MPSRVFLYKVFVEFRSRSLCSAGKSTVSWNPKIWLDFHFMYHICSESSPLNSHVLNQRPVSILSNWFCHVIISNISYEHNVYRFGHSKNSHNLISALFFNSLIVIFCKKADSLVWCGEYPSHQCIFILSLVHPKVPHFLVIKTFSLHLCNSYVL